MDQGSSKIATTFPPSCTASIHFTVMYFCSEGACIVARGQLIAAAFTQQLYNPQCFLQYQDQRKPPHHWNVSCVFLKQE